MKITFEFLKKKFAEREKDFGKKITPLSSEEAIFFTHREKNHAQYSSRGRGGRRGRGRRNFIGSGVRQAQSEQYDLHYIRYNKDWHDASTCRIPWEKIEQERNKTKGKTHDK